MSNYQTNPLKLYIQDIYRAKRTENKYIYELFNTTFKNVMIHGVVTSIYNTMENTTNLELSDPTGTIQVYYDASKSNSTIKKDTIKNLNSDFIHATKFNDSNIITMSILMDKIKRNKLDIKEGAYLSVIGDIFLSEFSVRMVSAYDCVQTSVERDVVWLEELRYMYEKFYLWKKE